MIKVLGLICLLSLVACSGEDAVQATIDAIPTPPPGATSPGEGSQGTEPSTPNEDKQQPAQGKLNGNEFVVVGAGLFQDPFSSAGAELVLTDVAIENCSNFHDRMVYLPIEDKTQYLGEHVAGANEGVVFYDYADGQNLNSYVVKSGGMSWTVSEDGEGGLKGLVEIPAEDDSDENFVVGSFEVQNCL